MTRQQYTSDLTDAQWALLAPLLPAAKPRRPTSVRGPAGSTARHIVMCCGAAAPGACCRTICPLADCVQIFPALDPGRHLGPHPGDLAAGGAGRRGQKPDPRRRYHRQSVCENHGKRGPRGYDAGKKVTGRKRHIIVDTIGMLLTVVVHPADMQDRDGAKLVMHRLQHMNCLSSNRRQGQTEDVAELASFLRTPRVRHTQGVAISVYGSATAGAY